MTVVLHYLFRKYNANLMLKLIFYLKIYLVSNNLQVRPVYIILDCYLQLSKIQEKMYPPNG